MDSDDGAPDDGVPDGLNLGADVDQYNVPAPVVFLGGFSLIRAVRREVWSSPERSAGRSCSVWSGLWEVRWRSAIL